MSRERLVVEDGDARDDATLTVEATGAARPDLARALGERVVELERELERRERQHARVVERYERLLEAAREEEADDATSWLRSLL